METGQPDHEDRSKEARSGDELGTQPDSSCKRVQLRDPAFGGQSIEAFTTGPLNPRRPVLASRAYGEAELLREVDRQRVAKRRKVRVVDVEPVLLESTSKPVAVLNAGSACGTTGSSSVRELTFSGVEAGGADVAEKFVVLEPLQPCVGTLGRTQPAKVGRVVADVRREKLALLRLVGTSRLS